ncbi:hypothetical protein [Azohydromonas australica]|uniref:hypothetical protein n=1 Tax=Azohydromonas australica TaxID=364039 RepID=UPI0012EB13D6|nr:hypothetical protein [Azohydromonas australica]
MKISDALAHLRSTSDQTHKFWAYYQAFSAAAVGFSWASKAPPNSLIYGLFFGYAVFAALNFRLIISSQRSALIIWNAINDYSKSPSKEEEIPYQFMPLLRLNKPDKPLIIGAIHGIVSISILLAIMARTWFPEISVQYVCPLPPYRCYSAFSVMAP